MRVRLCKTSVALHWNLISSFINLISTHINLDQPYINFYQPCINLYQYKPTLSPGCTCVLFTSAICDTNRRCRCMVQHCEQGFKYRVTRVGSWYDQSDHNPLPKFSKAAWTWSASTGAVTRVFHCRCVCARAIASASASVCVCVGGGASVTSQ